MRIEGKSQEGFSSSHPQSRHAPSASVAAGQGLAWFLGTPDDSIADFVDDWWDEIGGFLGVFQTITIHGLLFLAAKRTRSVIRIPAVRAI